MSTKCAVFNCETYTSSKRSFFRFPKDEELKRKWIKFCRREKNFDPKRSSIVCIDHFTTDDFQNNMQVQMGLAARLRLKPGAIPTVNTKTHTSKLQEQREERRQKRAYKQIVEKLLKEHTETLANENQVDAEMNQSESGFRKVNNFENDPMETTEILIERIPRVGFNENEENPLEECEYEDSSSNKNMSFKNENSLEDEMERIHTDNYLESELERITNDNYSELEFERTHSHSDNNMESEVGRLYNDINLESELERLHSDSNLESELEKFILSENYVEPIDERLHNEKYLESEVDRLRKEVEFLRSDNERLQNSEKKYLKTLAAVKKKYLTTLETAHRKYLESEDKYLYEINTLKERLESQEYENYNMDNKLYQIHEA